ncbi:MAG: roadblock/LC7 domain-containing protein [Candidatus Hermodarchaeota archaeon]|jgi:predicted regulator of Ras-like GTPase activity (Roadblock/LC7/MglB family)|nr:roadblock/LC7 domain-containing protein [Candidatus Hermodarchaeota archaeon]
MQSSADTTALSKVEEYLAETVKKEPTIRSAAVLTADGLPLVLLIGKDEVEKLELAAAIASLGALSEQTANRLRIGKYQDLMLRCSRGHLLVRWFGTANVLAVIADNTAPLGATTLIIDFMAKRLQRLLK